VTGLYSQAQASDLVRTAERVFRPRRRTHLLLWLSLAVLVLAALMGVAFGATSIPLTTALGAIATRLFPLSSLNIEGSEASATIILDLRLPRVALMALNGAALGAAGAAYQGLFRNPLADPYIIGVASGAGLGATLVLTTFAPATALGLLALPAGAFAGGLVAIARVGRSTPVTTMLLAGVAVGSFATSLTTFWMLRSPEGMLRAFNWLLGGYAGGGWAPVAILLPYLAAGLFVLLLSARSLNVLQLEEDEARQLGVNVERLKLLILGAATLMTAAAVAFSGLIGFVGLVVPHVLRMLGGPDYRWVIALSALGGASFLIVADLLARTLLAPQELPLAVITALVGTPFFVFLLRRLKRSVF
jgi:iron complex transport system permease protein